MTTLRLLAATAAFTLAPTAAFAVPDGPDGAGYNGGGAEAVVVNDTDPSDCSVPITVEGGNAATITVEVTDPSGELISTDTAPNDINGTVDFVISLGADCAGSYTITAFDEGTNVLALASVVAGESPVNGGGTDDGESVAADGSSAGSTTDGDDVGGLPSTGSSTALLVGGLAGLGLVAGGSVLLVRRRRAAA